MLFYRKDNHNYDGCDGAGKVYVNSCDMMDVGAIDTNANTELTPEMNQPSHDGSIRQSMTKFQEQNNSASTVVLMLLMTAMLMKP